MPTCQPPLLFLVNSNFYKKKIASLSIHSRSGYFLVRVVDFFGPPVWREIQEWTSLYSSQNSLFAYLVSHQPITMQNLESKETIYFIFPSKHMRTCVFNLHEALNEPWQHVWSENLKNLLLLKCISRFSIVL